MTPVSNNHNDHRPPTGNLEELFRQKMAEAELTPRADVWDRLDHELLLRENQGYRRRLVGYRRAAAAAVAVATLGIGGWLTQRTLVPAPGTEVAVVDSSAATRRAARLAQAAQPSAAGTARSTATARAASPAASTARPGFSNEDASAAGAVSQPETGLLAGTTAAPTTTPVDNLRESFGARRRVAAGRADQPSLINRAVAAIRQTFGGGAASPAGRSGSLLPASPALAPRGNAGATLLASTAPTGVRSTGVAAALAAAESEAEAMPFIASRLRRAGLGSNVPDSLKPALLSTPVLLAAQAPAAEEQDNQKASASSHWRWRGSFGAQRFAPNVSSVVGSGIAFSAMPTPTVAQRAPLPEEPTRLQTGLAQRGMFGVAVPLSKKHWTLLTGAEVAVISGRTGREVPQTLLNNNADEKFQTGRYHLTTVGVPVQVRYESRKQGWGVYAAVGAAVNVILRNRTAVGTQATTDDSSYRRMLATTRGSAGVRFSPASGNWQLNVGPEAEAGLTTLNANPSETWSQRTRPYALGLSASVEFGGGKAEPAR
ncbi:outer membrane beta-barrel protein [Hymenobacter edaphi]|uniref:Outer membrane protein beta-barrel domain-containing protein n=1 Tax=Hymenobacter edaphi TaxID=2211146 RepID=A0A328BJ86_9BACT|nr:outer membrane beta-barrel protein [Hymenobacter edaphi]RAK66715.1 hypothetical protein DLM85_10880 [Hymenobacter edaphi]